MKDTQFTQLTSVTNLDLIGEGVTAFLDGQLSINTKSLESGTAKLACFCNHKGRIVALFHIFLIENGVRLILPFSTIDAAQSHIKKYSVFFKVELSSHTAEIFSFCDQTNSVEQDKYIKVDQTDLLLECNQKPVEENLILSEDIPPEDLFWFEHLVSKEIAWLNGESVEHFLPHYLNLPKLQAIDFKKGCFTGQEVIARMQYKGKLKQHLQKLTADEILEISTKNKLYQDGKTVGEVVCVVFSAVSGTSLLATVKDSANLLEQFQTSPENSPILEIIS